MEVVLGALPSLLPKLAKLLKDEYNLQKEVKEGIRFLKKELESLNAALDKISKTPPDQLPSDDKIWARDVRELSYDIEDSIDTFMIQVESSEPAKKHGFKKFIDKFLDSLMQPKIRRKIAIDIRDIKSCVKQVDDRRRRNEVWHNVGKPVEVDHRLFNPSVRNLVGVDEARDEVIKILTKVNEVSKHQDKIVSIVGFGGLGKTTLAKEVHKKLRAKFHCSAFVSVSQTPDMDKLLKDMFRQLANRETKSVYTNNVIDELSEFLQDKRYFICIDDIWETKYWNTIRGALPDVSDGYGIITTTRNLTVAEEIGGVYKMKPLSLENSRILMHGIIFGKEDKGKCPDEQLAEVSDEILNKCAGVPLAIATIASLLACKGRNKLVWYDVCNSIGTGLEDHHTVDNMRKVLSLSYYDMPSHLRICLLYLSMFPEDYEVDIDRLIWLWIAEGFILSGKQERSLFVTGESYLSELINRSMIQPIYEEETCRIESCRVHDMVLDLLCFLSSKENFFTVWNGVDHPSSIFEKVRRLSLQNGKADHGKPKATMSIQQLRSVVVFPPAIDHVPTLQKLRFLRVLDLKDCDLSQGYSLKFLGNLLHLRYLGLAHTRIHQLPEEIGNLCFLQTLDVWANTIYSWPSTIVRLTHLLCLCIDEATSVQKWIGRLTALEHLFLSIEDDSTDITEELGLLTELRSLRIAFSDWNAGLNKSLVESLNKLHNVEDLTIMPSQSGRFCLDDWVAPRHLRMLYVQGCILSTLSAWVNLSLLLDLSSLEISVEGLQQEDLEILGRLPALRFLDLFVSDHKVLGIHGRFTVGACSFPRLVTCSLMGFGGPVVFEQGAMPRLAELTLEFPVRETREINGGFDLGLGNLPSLEEITVYFISEGASKEEVEEAKAAVRHAIEVHPNHPTLHIVSR